MAVSVVMPSYQAAQTIERAIASVQAQTRRDWELIVIDDGSTDGTPDLVKALADPRIRLIASDVRQGPAAARAQGSRLAQFDFISYFDADDLLYPDAFEVLEKTLQRPENKRAVLAYGHYNRIGPDDKPVGIKRFLLRPQRPSGDVLRAFLSANHLANGGCALVRKSAVLQTGCWDLKELKCAEDWAAWTLLATAGPFVFVPFLTALAYRETASGLSQSVNTRFENVVPTLDAVFHHPAIRAQIPADELAALRQIQEAHMWAYIAMLNQRRKDWPAGLEAIKKAIQLAPRRAPINLIKFILASFDAYAT